MTGSGVWIVVECLYVSVGGQLSPGLIHWLFGRDRVLGALAEPVPAFVVATAVIALWPMLLLLALEAE